MTTSHGFLVIDDEEVWRHLIARTLAPFRRVHPVASLTEASRALDEHGPWLGLVVDIQLGDGSGLDLLARLRQANVRIPALVLTAHQDAQRINMARALDAELACKPPEPGSLEGFARRAIALHWTRSERVARRIDVLSATHELTARECELVSAAVVGVSRRLVAEELGVSENTVKTQITRLLAKCQSKDLAQLSESLLRQALEGGAFLDPPRPDRGE